MRPDLDRVSSSSRRTRADDVAQRLRDLPSDLPPPFDWTEFRRRERERAWPKRSTVKWQHAAAAAGITVFIAGMAVWGRFAQHPDGVSSSVVMSPWSEPHDGADGADPNVRDAMQGAAQTAAAARGAAVAQAKASRQWLARQPAEPAVVRVGPRLAVANLEDRIAWMDDALTDERFGHLDITRVEALKQERARLVNSLAQVRYAETLAARVQ